MPTVSLILTPADVVMFRDSRPFSVGTTGSRSEFPIPQSIAGAVRTWLLRGLGADFSTLEHYRNNTPSVKGALLQWCPANHPAHWVIHAHLTGPILSKELTGYFPVPHNIGTRENDPNQLDKAFPLAHSLPGEPRRLDAPQPTMFHSTWPISKIPRSEDVKGYVNSATMQIEILDANGQIMPQDVAPPEEFFDIEPRLGIGVNSDRMTAEEGYLYTAGFTRLKEGVGFRVDITTSPAVPLDQQKLLDTIKIVAQKQPWLRLGGEGKIAHVEIHDTPSWPVPPHPWPSPDGRFFTYLATPGVFQNGSWYPHELAKTCTLVGVRVGLPLVFSGWDRAMNRPMKTRCAVRAGAVHFWEIQPGIDPNTIPDPHGTHISDAEDDRQAGWGLCLRGAWNYV